MTDHQDPMEIDRRDLKGIVRRLEVVTTDHRDPMEIDRRDLKGIVRRLEDGMTDHQDPMETDRRDLKGIVRRSEDGMTDHRDHREIMVIDHSEDGMTDHRDPMETDRRDRKEIVRRLEVVTIGHHGPEMTDPTEVTTTVRLATMGIVLPNREAVATVNRRGMVVFQKSRMGKNNSNLTTSWK